MKALILIGGEGTRLRPLTLNTLKCMVPIVNRHFFEYQLALLKKYGVHEVILSICYLPGKIEKAIGNGKKYGLKIRYVKETKPLGTAGAIKNAEKYLDDTTIVMNGDILTDINIGKMVEAHKAKHASATIALHEVEDPSAYGLVLTDKHDRILKFLEKPKEFEITSKWINAGIYILDKKMIGDIPGGRNVSIERQAFPGMIEKGEILAAYKSKSYWLDIGRIDKYKQANFDLLEGKFESPFAHEKNYRDSVIIGKQTKTEHGASFSGPVVIGEDCRIKNGTYNPLAIVGNKCSIGSGVTVERSIIWENVKIGDGAMIMDSIIGSGCVIEENAVLNGSVIGDKTRVTRHSRLGG